MVDQSPPAILHDLWRRHCRTLAAVPGRPWLFCSRGRSRLSVWCRHHAQSRQPTAHRCFLGEWCQLVSGSTGCRFFDQLCGLQHYRFSGPSQRQHPLHWSQTLRRTSRQRCFCVYAHQERAQAFHDPERWHYHPAESTVDSGSR